MSELPINHQNSEQEQQATMPESQVQAEIVIEGQVFNKTVLPAVTRENSLGKRGGVKRLPTQSRELTPDEEKALGEMKREECSIYDRKFSDYGGPVNANAPHDISWDNANRVNGAHIPDDSLLNQDELQDRE